MLNPFHATGLFLYYPKKTSENSWVLMFSGGTERDEWPELGIVLKKNKSLYFLLSRPYHFKFFKGCLPQILLGPFLNTLTKL